MQSRIRKGSLGSTQKSTNREPLARQKMEKDAAVISGSCETRAAHDIQRRPIQKLVKNSPELSILITNRTADESLKFA
jgi:hypothetical protein